MERLTGELRSANERLKGCQSELQETRSELAEVQRELKVTTQLADEHFKYIRQLAYVLYGGILKLQYDPVIPFGEWSHNHMSPYLIDSCFGELRFNHPLSDWTSTHPGLAEGKSLELKSLALIYRSAPQESSMDSHWGVPEYYYNHPPVGVLLPGDTITLTSNARQPGKYIGIHGSVRVTPGSMSPAAYMARHGEPLK